MHTTTFLNSTFNMVTEEDQTRNGYHRLPTECGQISTESTKWATIVDTTHSKKNVPIHLVHGVRKPDLKRI